MYQDPSLPQPDSLENEPCEVTREIGSELTPRLRAEVRSAKSTTRVDDSHLDIYKIVFAIELPDDELTEKWPDVSEKTFYRAIEQLRDAVISDVVLDGMDGWKVSIFRMLDHDADIKPSKTNHALTAPFPVNHPKIASIGGASHLSMGLVVIVSNDRSTPALTDYSLTLKVEGHKPSEQQICLNRV